jgi:hypothetical protein
MRLEIDAPGCRSSVRRSTAPTWPQARHEKLSQGTPAAMAATDGRVEPKRPPASLPRIPDGDNLLRSCDRLALGLGALRFGRCPRGGPLPFLCSAVWSHSRDRGSFWRRNQLHLRSVRMGEVELGKTPCRTNLPSHWSQRAYLSRP